MIEVKLKHPPKGPLIFKRMIDRTNLSAEKGDIVRVVSNNGIFGYAFYNPDSNIVLRLITRSDSYEFDVEQYIYESIRKAISFRKRFNLPSDLTNCYRLIYDWSDGLSGLVCDIFDRVGVFELYSYAYYIRMDFLKRVLKELLGVDDIFFVSSSYTQTMERFKLDNGESRKIRIKENGISFEIIVGEGYKTGFFCDQRENRYYLTNFVEGKKVLDLFSYTAGFGIYAKRYGAKEVRCVELDIDACKMAKRNANINFLKIDVVNADAFSYLRQIISNGEKFDVVICDPYKFISSRENKEEGLKKYHDINKLVFEVVNREGLVVTCSCSGLLSFDEFVEVIKKAASSSKRVVRIFKKTGAGPDHPFMVNYPEGEYLKVIWCFVE